MHRTFDRQKTRAGRSSAPCSGAGAPVRAQEADPGRPGTQSAQLHRSDPRRLRPGPQDRRDDRARRARRPSPAHQFGRQVVTFFALQRLRPSAGDPQHHRRPQEPARRGEALAGVKRSAELPPLRRAGQAARGDRIPSMDSCAVRPIWRTSAPASVCPTGSSPSPPLLAPRQLQRAATPARRPGCGGALHLRQLRRAARGDPDPGQHAGQRRADRLAHRARPQLGDVSIRCRSSTVSA